ncbi:hypothetical protein Tco_0916835 [Tanacetum coccineum]
MSLADLGGKSTLISDRSETVLRQKECLEKTKESNGFAEIIDFLKASSVHYALTLQALVDKKRVIAIESRIRRDLHLDDAECTDCLPTATIFEELARMGYEKPS